MYIHLRNLFTMLKEDIGNYWIYGLFIQGSEGLGSRGDMNLTMKKLHPLSSAGIQTLQCQ